MKKPFAFIALLLLSKLALAQSGMSGVGAVIILSIIGVTKGPFNN